MSAEHVENVAMPSGLLGLSHDVCFQSSWRDLHRCSIHGTSQGGQYMETIFELVCSIWDGSSKQRATSPRLRALRTSLCKDRHTIAFEQHLHSFMWHLL